MRSIQHFFIFWHIRKRVESRVESCQGISPGRTSSVSLKGERLTSVICAACSSQLVQSQLIRMHKVRAESNLGGLRVSFVHTSPLWIRPTIASSKHSHSYRDSLLSLKWVSSWSVPIRSTLLHNQSTFVQSWSKLVGWDPGWSDGGKNKCWPSLPVPV